MSENELLQAVLRLCEKHNVLVFHDNDSRKNKAGFPDLIMIGGFGIAFAELKTQYGKESREQTIWRYRLEAACQEHYLWRPSDLESGDVEYVLKRL